MNGMAPPHDLEAEQSLLGAVIIRPSIVKDINGSVDPADFYKPAHQWMLNAAYELHDHGQPIDAVTLAAELQRNGLIDDVGGSAYINELMNATPSVSNYATYADIVVDCSRRRRVIEELAEMTTEAYSRGMDIDEILGRVELIPHSSLIAKRTSELTGLYDIVEFACSVTDEDIKRPWLIEHLCKPMWRTMIVAPEGVGKAVLLRFLGIHAAAGRDPWQPEVFTSAQRKVLYVDTENPAETILHQLRIANRAHGTDLIAEAHGFFSIWHREGGMDLRQRRVQIEFEHALQKSEPEIVMMGPLYKLYRRSPREDMEQAALEFTEILDDFRVRYGFALFLEHHAPKATGGTFRELNPFGSSLYMRWPEIGITLDYDGNVGPDDIDYTLKVGRFRRDRVVNDWPSYIERDHLSAYAWKPMWPLGRLGKLAAA